MKTSLWMATLALAVTSAAMLAAVPADAADNSLKELMKKMGGQVAAGDAKSLGPIFEQTKAKGKPEFSNWSAIADKGKAASAAGDLAAAKATCKECHDAYRDGYKTKYGSKAP
jgi:hypothetical protein